LITPLGPFVEDAALLRALDALTSAAQSRGEGAPLARAAEIAHERVSAIARAAATDAPLQLLVAGGTVLVGPRLLRLPRSLRIQAMVLTELLRARGGELLSVAADARPEDWLAFARRLAPGSRAPLALPTARVRQRPAPPGLIERVLDAGEPAPPALAARAFGAAVVAVGELLAAIDPPERVPEPTALMRAVEIARTLMAIGKDEAQELAKVGWIDRDLAVVRAALLAIGLARHVGATRRTCTEIAAATLLQALAEAPRDDRAFDRAARALFGLARLDPRLQAVAVTAHEALRARAGVDEDEPIASAEGRLVAAAWDEALGAVVDVERVSVLEIDVDLSRLSRTSGAGGRGRPSLDPSRLAAPMEQGRLDGAGLPAVLARAMDRAFSGTLLLIEPEGARHAIVLAEGAPLRAWAPRSPSLGDVLVATAGVDAEQAQDAIARAAADGGSPLAILAAEGALDEEGRRAAIAVRTAARIGAIATLGEATRWQLHEGVDLLAATAEECAPLDPRCAILVAARHTAGRTAMNAALRRDERPIAIAPGVELQRYAPSAAELEVLDVIATTRAPLSAHLAEGRLRAEVARPILYALLVTGGLA
jgi:hypothetical protein